MRIILSPAKKMNVDVETLPYRDLPKYIKESEQIYEWLVNHSKEELTKLWGCSEKIAEQSYERLQNMDLQKHLTPAIISYEGIAFQYMAPAVFEDGQMEYVQKHLRILSAFYGVLKPLDGVTPYRLEMQAKARIDGHANLYEFWGQRLYENVRDESGIIINLASKEYSKCMERYLTEQDRYITITFCEKKGDKLVTKGTYAKMARGEMVRFMAERQIENPEEMKQFHRLGYEFREDISDENEFVFERVGMQEKAI